ncbi:MAG: hypothetical protein GXP32_06015 [Kiritimatiellaeota bacterium]|nr:hypothetical protein [Kiritimatiellota bacterium]
MAGFILATSCALLEKKEEDAEPADLEMFANKTERNKTADETIDDERVKLDQKKSLITESRGDEIKLSLKKKNESPRKGSVPFYEKYLKNEGDSKLPIFMNLDAVSIQDVIPAFAGLLGFSYIVDPAVKGTITVNVQNPLASDKRVMMSKRDAWRLFEQILWLSGAYCSPENDILHIMPFSKMSREHEVFSRNGVITNISVRIFDIRNVPAKTVLDKINDFLTEGAKATELTGENALMIVDTPNNMRKLEGIIKMLDTKRRTSWPRSVIRCENVSSKHIVSELATILPVLGFPMTVDNVVAEPGAIHLTQIERLQVIVASAANQEALDEVVKWVSILDRSDVGSQEQVFIYKVINSKAEDLLNVLATIFKVDGVAVSQEGAFGSSSSTVDTSGGSGGSGGSASSQSKTATTVVKSSSSGTGKGNGPASVFEVPVKIFADGSNNRIVTRTTPRTYAMIKALLKRLDTIPTQVLLQVLIAEIRLGENTEFGVEWAGTLDIGNKTGGVGTNYSGLIPQMPANPNERGFKYLIRNGANKYAYIRGLAGTGNFKILATPQLAAVSGTAATLDVGQEIPIVTRTLSDTNTTSTLSTSNEVEYKKIGILLKIIPKVTRGGLITIDLNQTVSARGEDVSAGGTSYPSFINRQVVTALSMRDGSTLLVGGIIQETDRSQNDSMPFIAKVPILATLLGYSTKQIERTELLIMITASIIKEKSDLQKMVSRYKQSIALIKKFNESVKKKKKKRKDAGKDEK